jgi:hypothetical protein
LENTGDGITTARLDAAVSLARGDLDGLYMQHANMWTLFTTHIRTLVTVLGGPVVLLGVLISAKAIKPESDLRDLPTTLGMVLVASGFLGSFLLHVLVRYRLDILMYSRAINSLRRDYVRLLNPKCEEIIAPAMPTTVTQPINLEWFRIMGLLVLGSMSVICFYFILGCWILTDHEWTVPAFVAFATTLINGVAYVVEARDRPIAGGDGLPEKDPADYRLHV